MRLASGNQRLSVASPSSVWATTIWPGMGDALFVNDDVIAVGDLGVDHRIAAHFESEQVLLAEHGLEIDPLVLLDGFVQHAGGNPARQRQTALIDGLGHELNCPRHIRLAGDQPLLFQGLEVAHHAVGRADSELIADFAAPSAHSRDCESCRE